MTVWPPTVSVPVRELADEFADTEIVTVPANKPFLTLQGLGSSPSATVIVNNHWAGGGFPGGSATMFVNAPNSTLTNLTVSNDFDESTQTSGQQAVALLQLLGAVDADRKLTPHGGHMAALPVHPRLAHMLIEARRLGETGLAAEIAALLSDRDIARRSAARQGGPPSLPDADIRLRIEALRRGRGTPALAVDSGALHRARAEAAEWRKRLHASSGGSEDDVLAVRGRRHLVLARQQ